MGVGSAVTGCGDVTGGDATEGDAAGVTSGAEETDEG